MKNTTVSSLQQLPLIALLYLGLSANTHAQQELEQQYDQDTQQEFFDELTDEQSDDYTANQADIADQYTPEIPQQQQQQPEEQQPIEDGQADIQAPEDEAKKAAMDVEAFKKCVKSIIANDIPVEYKREEIDSQCQVQRDQIFQSLPRDYSEYMLLNMDRRIDMVIQTMKEAQMTIDDTAEDIQKAVDELSTDTAITD